MRLDSRSVVMAFVLLIVGIGLGRFTSVGRVEGSIPPPYRPGELEHARIGFSQLTNPFLECIGEQDYDPRLRRARGHILSHLEDLQAADTTLRVSVYARDLLNGPWMGIDERMPFQPASLMKVAILFHALARMESDPGLRGERLLYPGPDAMPSPDNLADRPPEERMEPGRSYTYEELLERMIVYSDNHAKDLVLTDVDPAEIDDFMARVGVPKIIDHGRPVMNARAYGALFRILYNSTVFSRPSSEYALSLLIRGRYPDGLRAPLPPETIVASKFGIHRDPGHPEDGNQLHECGIVYAGEGPYVLCVMSSSRKQSVKDLAQILAQVSEVVYYQQ